MLTKKYLLIQRFKKLDKLRDYKKGIDQVLKLAYMGKADFEFGAIPDSLKMIRSKKNEYVYLDVPINDKVITVFCHNSVKSEIKTYLTELKDSKISTTGSSYFNYFIEGNQRFDDTNGWWDLINHIMFWEKDSDFELRFKNRI